MSFCGQFATFHVPAQGVPALVGDTIIDCTPVAEPLTALTPLMFTQTSAVDGVNAIQTLFSLVLIHVHPDIVAAGAVGCVLTCEAVVAHNGLPSQTMAFVQFRPADGFAGATGIGSPNVRPALITVGGSLLDSRPKYIVQVPLALTPLNKVEMSPMVEKTPERLSVSTV